MPVISLSVWHGMIEPLSNSVWQVGESMWKGDCQKLGVTTYDSNLCTGRASDRTIGLERSRSIIQLLSCHGCLGKKWNVEDSI